MFVKWRQLIPVLGEFFRIFTLTEILVVSMGSIAGTVVAANPIKWRINLPENMEITEASTAQPYKFLLPATTTDFDKSLSSKIRLVDWREWNRMRPAYSATVGAPPLLIVDTNAVLDKPSTTTTVVIPEADETESTATSTTTSATTTLTTTTTPALPTTIQSSTESQSSTPADSNSTDVEPTTALKSVPDMTLELRNLPNMLTLLKHLSLIPAVVRSFSSAAISTAGQNIDGFSMTASPNPLSFLTIPSASQQPSNELRSRALSDNSGYSARAPQFITAPPAESEIAQTFVGRRPQKPPPNMPAPIVPVNNRQEAMRPREVSNSIRDLNYFPSSNRLNIYGINPAKTPFVGRDVNVLIDRDPTAYNAPMIQAPISIEPKRRQRPRFDISNLTVNEVEQLESIHRKLFQQLPSTNLSTTTNMVKSDDRNVHQIQSPPLPLKENNSLFVFEKPKQTNTIENAHNPLATNELAASTVLLNPSLKPEIINELMMIKDIPDLEELTKGMDLSLLSKPGGFAVLKEEFIQRLIQRTLLQKQKLRKFRRNRQKH